MHKIFLGLGSNVGDRSAHIEAAVQEMSPEILILSRSAIYETAPWGYEDQADFLNTVIEAETNLAPHGLLTKVKDIEKRVGRQATFRNGPREIDIDILLYDDLQFAQGDLNIPHPRLHERVFMLVPLAELSSDLKIPGQSQSVAELLKGLDASGIREYIAKPTG